MVPSSELRSGDLDPATPGAGQIVNPVMPALLALFILGGQVFLIASRGFANVLETPFLPYCLLGAFSIHMAARPGRLESLTTFGLGCAFAAGFAILRPGFQWTWPNCIAGLSSVGLASLVVLTAQVARLRGIRQQERLNTLIAGSVFAYSALFIAFILNLTTTLHPKTYDLYLYKADAGFGVPIAASAGVFLTHHSFFAWTCGLIYETLPLAISLLYAYEQSGRKPLPIRVLPAFLGGGAAAYLLYNILPAAGPLYIFGADFPNHLPRTVQAVLRAPLLHGAPRNAVPSMHLTCALMLFWNARHLSRSAYAATAVYLGLTVIATLGLGEHYVVDLVAAVPYTLLLQAACAREAALDSPHWRRALAVGVGLTFAWMAALRFGGVLFHSIPLTWIAATATVAGCLFVQQRMKEEVKG